MKIRESKETTPDIDSLLDRAMAAARRRGRAAIGAPALAGALALSGPALTGCMLDTDTVEVGTTDQADWVQYEGQRNTEMVSYLGGYWSECASYTSRFGCSTIDVFLKVRVKPVYGANLDHKQVGVVWRSPIDNTEQTAFGYYFTTWSNGEEEWHVPVSVPAWKDYFLFNTFYRDGNYHTYYDDNNGEYHVVNAGPTAQIIRVNPWASSVTVANDRVQGKVSLRVADLDWDKQIELLGTTDDWQTVHTLGLGSSGELNKWYWTQDVYGGDLFEIDLDLPASSSRFEYAVVYRHGVVNGAKTYEFWDNNFGYNHVVEEQVVE